jgi:hypothetical protein
VFIKADVRHDDEVRKLSIRRLPASAGSMPPSTAPAPRASRAASPIRPPRATRPPSTPTCLGCY